MQWSGKTRAMRGACWMWATVALLGVPGCGGDGTQNESDVAAPQCTSWEECVDSNPCTQHECVEGQCVTTPIAGKTCDDGSVCTGNDRCDDQGECVGELVLQCDDDNPCTLSSCDPALGCVSGNMDDGTACETGLLCTVDDVCQGGVCVEGLPRDCPDENPLDCSAFACDPETGECSVPVIVSENSGCEDGDPCTVGDRCSLDGTCVPGGAPVCTSLHPCKEGKCDSATPLGQDPCKEVWRKNGSPCDDLDVCTILDVCVLVDGTAEYDCIGLDLDCSITDPCKIGYCKTGVGCVADNVLDGHGCGLPGHACVQGVCSCLPQCADKECGDNSCGGSCGTCGPGLHCWQHQCIPDTDECFDGNDVPWDGCTGGLISETRLDPAQTAVLGAPDVAAFDDGSFVVVWEAGTPMVGGSPTGIVARIYHSDLTPKSAVFKVDVNTSGKATAPRVAIAEGGNFFVVWFDDVNSGDKAVGRIFKKTGEAETGQFSIGSGTGQEHRYPDVSRQGTGFVVGWQRRGVAATKWEVRVQRFNSFGNTIANQIEVNTEGQSATRPTLSNTDSGFVVCWQQFVATVDNVDQFGVGCHRYDVGGGMAGTAFSVWPGTYAGATRPDVAGTASGGFLVSWIATLYDPEAPPGVTARGYTSAGAATSGVWTASTTTHACDSPRATLTTSGRLALSYTQNGKVFVRMHKADLGMESPIFQANINDHGPQGPAAGTGLSDDVLLVVWVGKVDAGSSGTTDALFGRRFVGTGTPLYP